MAATRRWLWTSVLAAGVACGDSDHTAPDGGPTTSGPDLDGLVLSAPVPPSFVDGESGPGSLVFVSARPGELPRGARAFLGRKGAAPSLEFRVEAGGFDPVALRAELGDEIEVTVTDSSGGRSVETGTVRAPMRPKVVRTSPGPQRSDVPLNLVMQVVFSTPMNPASVSSALGLFRGGVRVPGSVSLTEGNGTTASFVPDGALDPSSDYRLEVSSSARDVLGATLDSTVVVTFRTGALGAPAAIALVQLDSTLAVLSPGDSVGARAYACTQSVLPCAPVLAPVTWTSSAPGVASVGPQGASQGWSYARVRALAPGVAQIVARSGTVADTMDVLVRSSTPPATLASNELVFARTNLFAIRGDGTGLVQLTSGGQQSEPSVAADGRIVYVETNPSDIYTRELRIREVDGRVRRLAIPPLASWAPPRCPAWSPDMRYIAYLEVAPYYDSGVLRVIRSDSTTVLVASAGQGPEVTCPRWSPDGTRLSFAEVPDVYEGPLWGASRPAVWPLGASTSGFLAGGSLLPGAWSPAGDALSTIEGDGESFWIGRLPLDGSAFTRLWLVSEVIAWGNPARSVPAWSPDGSLIAYSVTRGQVWLTDAGSAGPSWWGAMLVEGRDPAFVPAGVRFTR